MAQACVDLPQRLQVGPGEFLAVVERVQEVGLLVDLCRRAAGWPAAPARPPLPPGRTASSAVGTSTPTDWRPPPEPLEERSLGEEYLPQQTLCVGHVDVVGLLTL